MSSLVGSMFDSLMPQNLLRLPPLPQPLCTNRRPSSEKTVLEQVGGLHLVLPPVPNTCLLPLCLQMCLCVCMWMQGVETKF